MKYLSLLMTVCALLTMCILPAHAIESYTVTEGFCLLFLLLGFCWCVWKIIKGGLF